jgi:hypothetical protein
MDAAAAAGRSLLCCFCLRVYVEVLAKLYQEEEEVEGFIIILLKQRKNR